MTTTIVGCVADALGAASQNVVVAYHGPEQRNFDVRHEFFALPSIEYRSVQAPAIRVDENHGRPIGELRYLERSEQRLYGVAEIDASGLGPGPWFFSPMLRHRDFEDIELLAVAVTHDPAQIALDPVAAFDGGLCLAASSVVHQDGLSGELVRRALAYDRKRRRSEPLVIQGVHKRHAAAALPLVEAAAARLEYRSAADVDVHYDRRELDLLIAPAESPAEIVERTRSYTETFTHGCFADGADPERVRVNRDHSRERTCGRALSFDAWHELGLVGTVQLSKTPLGQESLTLAAEGCLDVSAAFKIRQDEWPRPSSRRVLRAELVHIALVPEPAYEGAKVLAVRGQQQALERRIRAGGRMLSERQRRLMCEYCRERPPEPGQTRCIPCDVLVRTYGPGGALAHRFEPGGDLYVGGKT